MPAETAGPRFPYASIEDVPEDVREALQHGFDAEDAWDIAATTALFGLSNQVPSVTGLMPNPEFYLMGRVPRERT